MGVRSFKCPGCGAPLRVDSGTRHMVCEYCGASLVVDDDSKLLSLENAEEAGYRFEKGRQRAQVEQRPQTGLRNDTEPTQADNDPSKHALPESYKKVISVVTWLFVILFPAYCMFLSYCTDQSKPAPSASQIDELRKKYYLRPIDGHEELVQILFSDRPWDDITPEQVLLFGRRGSLSVHDSLCHEYDQQKRVIRFKDEATLPASLEFVFLHPSGNNSEWVLERIEYDADDKWSNPTLLYCTRYCKAYSKKYSWMQGYYVQGNWESERFSYKSLEEAYVSYLSLFPEEPTKIEQLTRAVRFRFVDRPYVGAFA